MYDHIQSIQRRHAHYAYSAARSTIPDDDAATGTQRRSSRLRWRTGPACADGAYIAALILVRNVRFLVVFSRILALGIIVSFTTSNVVDSGITASPGVW